MLVTNINKFCLSVALTIFAFMKQSGGHTERRDNVFELIRAMSKAEKRNFKLYATRLGGNEEAKFMALFDCMDALDVYDEARILQRCTALKKEQLPNMKAHLYRQLLISLRLLNVNHSNQLQLAEYIDFARILFDKGLYNQAEKMLDKAEAIAENLEQLATLLDILELRKQVQMVNVSSDMTHMATAANRRMLQLCQQIETISEISELATRLYSLHLQLGYARSQKDLDLLNNYFKPKLDKYASRKLSFTERFYFYQAMAWYHYIRHNFSYSYRYGRSWIVMFDDKPEMKEVMYDSYLRGYSRVLEGMFLMRKNSLFLSTLADFERECKTTGSINENAMMISQQILFTNRLNKNILEGAFKEGLWITKSIDSYLKRYAKHITVHDKMMLDYKIAQLYFGDGNFTKCMEHLSYIIAVKDPRIRRDLQCYARMLNLIASYDAGIDYNLDYQIRSVFTFVMKMHDMTEMKKEIFAFLRRINNSAPFNVKKELKTLYQHLKPYENHPYERRTFYYLELMTWLESKITGRNFGDIVREKYDALVRSESKVNHAQE